MIDGWTGVRIAIGAVLLTAAYGCFRSSMYEVEIEFYKKQKEDLLVAKKVQDSQRTAAVIGSC